MDLVKIFALFMIFIFVIGLIIAKRYADRKSKEGWRNR